MNQGHLTHKRETLHNYLFSSNFTIDFLQEKMKIWNLNNSKIGGSSWKPKLSAISPFRDGSPNIIGFEEDPPDFRAREPRKSIPYAKSSYFMK